jgi:3-oxoacyl-[acyl-carrier-protein] synthase-1/3-oxoacyl-[acyl-carrier-protein] synthase II
MAVAPVVTGIGCVCALGRDPGEALDALCRGERPIADASALGKEAMPFPVFTVFESILGETRSRSAADTLRLAVVAADAAFAMARLPEGGRRGMGVVMGTTAGTALHFLAGYDAFRRGDPGDGADIADYFSSNLALRLGGRFGLGGPAVTLSNACTSGTDAIGLAADMVRLGVCDRVLCGGADALSLVPHSGFARLMIADREPCRPFDRDRAGLNLGEGAAVLVLESPAAARERGATALGFVAGFGQAADAHHLTAPHPEGRGLETAIRRAFLDADLQMEDVAFVNAHGTATRENDKVEGRTLARLLPGVPVWAGKGATGHALGAAGAIEAALTLAALGEGRLPPSAGFRTVDPEIGVVPTSGTSVPALPCALSTSLGFGGGNAALLLGGCP